MDLTHEAILPYLTDINICTTVYLLSRQHQKRVKDPNFAKLVIINYGRGYVDILAGLPFERLVVIISMFILTDFSYLYRCTTWFYKANIEAGNNEDADDLLASGLVTSPSTFLDIVRDSNMMSRTKAPTMLRIYRRQTTEEDVLEDDTLVMAVVSLSVETVKSIVSKPRVGRLRIDYPFNHVLYVEELLATQWIPNLHKADSIVDIAKAIPVEYRTVALIPVLVLDDYEMVCELNTIGVECHRHHFITYVPLRIVKNTLINRHPKYLNELLTTMDKSQLLELDSLVKEYTDE